MSDFTHRGRRTAEQTALKLTDEQRHALEASIRQSGFEVLLTIMETGCIMQDTVLTSVDPADREAVLAEHRITVAKWEYFAWVQKQIDLEIAKLHEPEAADPLTPEQRQIMNITGPTPDQDL